MGMLRVPLFLLALLVVRGLPAVLYRSALGSILTTAAGRPRALTGHQGIGNQVRQPLPRSTLVDHG
jgi:hypothetical protein